MAVGILDERRLTDAHRLHRLAVGREAALAALSVHSIATTRREAFYWTTILFTFALGTAAGDLISEKFGLGYLTAVVLFAGMIAVVTAAHYAVKWMLGAQHKHQSTNAVLAFWMAYILSRPLGASIGDFLSQKRGDGGLQFGTTKTSALFLALILGLVVFLTLTKKDEVPLEPLKPALGGSQAR